MKTIDLRITNKEEVRYLEPTTEHTKVTVSYLLFHNYLLSETVEEKQKAVRDILDYK